MSLHYRDIQNQSTGSFNDLNADNIEIGSVSSDSIQTDAITGKSNANQLSLLGSNITNTNTGFLSGLNQALATTSTPAFTGIKIKESTGDQFATISISGDLLANAVINIPTTIGGTTDDILFVNLEQFLF